MSGRLVLCERCGSPHVSTRVLPPTEGSAQGRFLRRCVGCGHDWRELPLIAFQRALVPNAGGESPP